MYSAVVKVTKLRDTWLSVPVTKAQKVTTEKKNKVVK